MSNARSVKNYTVTLVLVIFSGFLGGHRFYAGKVGTGLLFLFTGGFFLIGWLIDIFTVAFGNFTDKTGSFIRPEIREAGPSNMSETSNPPGETSEATPTSSDGKKKGVPTWVWIVAGVLVFGFILQSCGGDTSSPETQSEAPVSETTEEDTSSVAEPEAEPEPEPERVPSEDVAYNGSGDSILQLELPAGPDSVGIASITHSGGSNFSIWSLDENLEQSDLLVNEIGNYSGTVPFSLSSGERITAFEISADGPWTVTLRDILTVREATQGSTTTGDGADVLLYRGATTVASISHEGGSNFSVWSYGPDTDLLVNEIGSYSGEVRWPAGVALIKVGADGTWSIALQ